METYRFTAFEKSGEVLFDEVWTFENEDLAKMEGQKRIEENRCSRENTSLSELHQENYYYFMFKKL